MEEEDFTADAVLEGPPPIRVAVTLHERRETTRARLAGGLTLVFAVLVLGAGAAVWTGGVDVKDVKDVLQILLSPVVALTGSAIGFYFGGEHPPETARETSAGSS